MLPKALDTLISRHPANLVYWEAKATVLERTREIGLLRAIGATRAHIQQQFLLESATVAGIATVRLAMTS